MNFSVLHKVVTITNITLQSTPSVKYSIISKASYRVILSSHQEQHFPEHTGNQNEKNPLQSRCMYTGWSTGCCMGGNIGKSDSPAALPPPHSLAPHLTTLNQHGKLVNKGYTDTVSEKTPSDWFSAPYLPVILVYGVTICFIVFRSCCSHRGGWTGRHALRRENYSLPVRREIDCSNGRRQMNGIENSIAGEKKRKSFFTQVFLTISWSAM